MGQRQGEELRGQRGHADRAETADTADTSFRHRRARRGHVGLDMDIDTLADLELPDAAGAAHRLGDLWADRPIVLVFLRHFG